MAILEKEVWVGLGGSNITYYENLGYSIPRTKNKKGESFIPKKSKILVKIEDIQMNSGVKVTKVCDECRKICIKQTTYQRVMRDRLEGKDRCISCGSKKAELTKKENIIYEKTLQYYAITNDKKYLITEYSEKNNKKPNQISFGTADVYLWNCPDCKSEYTMNVHSRTRGCNCPYCAGKRVNHTNCIMTTRPDIGMLLLDEKVAYQITANSNKVEFFKCPNCSYLNKKKVNQVTSQGFSCKRCSDGISYPEKFMINMLNQLGLKFDRDLTFYWSNNKRYDFYIPSLNLIIETHGIQHYYDNIFKGGRSLEEEQENDNNKETYAKFNGIKDYIVIDCRKSELEYIKNQIIESRIKELLIFKNIDWLKCHEFACSSLMKTACDLWKVGNKSTVEIGKIIKVTSATVSNYLKQGNIAGWCDYSPYEITKNNCFILGKNRSKRIIQMSMNFEFIKDWESVTSAASELNISISCISSNCLGKTKSAGNFIFIYAKDFEENKVNLQKYLKKDRSRSVVRLCKNGIIIDEHKSIKIAADTLNMESSCISVVCQGKRNYAYGYKWMYKEDYDKYIQEQYGENSHKILV